MRHLPFVLALAFAAPASAAELCYDLEEVTVYDADGVSYPGVSWYGVNNQGVFAGNYCLDAWCDEAAGAVYDSRDGSVVTFAIEGYTARTDTPRINDRGYIVGTAYDFDGNTVAFVRDPDGTITLLDHLDGFAALDINNRGQIAGFFEDGPYQYHGAIVSGPGWTEVEYYEIEGTDYNALWGITDSGDLLASWEYLDFSPWYYNGYDLGHGWERLTLADGYEAGTAWGINNRGQIAGALLDYDTWTHPGFVRDRDGDTSLVWYGDPADQMWTAVLDINDNGVIAGTFDRYDRGMIGWPVACE